MNVPIVSLVFLFLIYIGWFSIFRGLFEKINGPISKHLLIDTLKRGIKNPTRGEQKIVKFVDKGICGLFWFIIWGGMAIIIDNQPKARFLVVELITTVIWPIMFMYIIIIGLILKTQFRNSRRPINEIKGGVLYVEDKK